jgi:TRAP-type C4-dicarboxylate transport system permease small subunit
MHPSPEPEPAPLASNQQQSAPGAAPSSVESFLKRLRQLEGLLTFAAFAVMVVVVFADVVTREITGSGLLWARQVGVYANIFVVMLGFGLASADGAHLRPRFADNWLPRSWERFLPHVQEALMALFCLTFCLIAAGVLAETFTLKERSVVLRLVIWPVQAVIPVAFGIASVRHGLYAIWPVLRPPEVAAEGVPLKSQP